MQGDAMTTRKVALITGGGTGIGAAIAMRLASGGVNVAINHLGEVDEAPARELAQACRDAGSDAVVIQADVGIPEDCSRLLAKAAAAWGRLDYLVNNAGYSHGRKLQDLDGIEVAEFERAFAVNSIGPFLLIRGAAHHMRRGGGGAVVNIASMAGLVAQGSSHGYCASKAAQIQLTRTLARVLGPEIRINVICPGLVETAHVRKVMKDRYQDVIDLAGRQNVLGRILQPDDIAEVAVMLLTGAGQITGEVIRVDGGGHLGGKETV